MGTQGKGTYIVHSSWASGNLVFYEKAVGRTVTGDIFTIAGGTTGYVRVGGTAQDIDFQFYATGSLSAIIDAGAATLTLTGITTLTDKPLTFSASADSAAVADTVTFGGYDISAGHRALALGCEEVVITEAAGASDRSLPVRINGASYKFLLHT